MFCNHIFEKKNQMLISFLKIIIDTLIGYLYSTNPALCYKQPRVFVSFIKIPFTLCLHRCGCQMYKIGTPHVYWNIIPQLYIYIHIHPCVCVCVCVCACVYIFMNIYMYRYINSYYIYIYISYHIVSYHKTSSYMYVYLFVHKCVSYRKISSWIIRA